MILIADINHAPRNFGFIVFLSQYIDIMVSIPQQKYIHIEINSTTIIRRKLNMTQRIALITGINGMDGSHLADLLLDKGYLVYGM